MVEKFEIVVDDITTLSGKYKIKVEYIQGDKIILTLYDKPYYFTEFTKLESIFINFKDNDPKLFNTTNNYYNEDKLYENFPTYISGLVRMVGIGSYQKSNAIMEEFNKFNLKSYRREKRLQKILKINEN